MKNNGWRIIPVYWLLFLTLLVFLACPPGLKAQTALNPTPVDYKLPFPGLLPDHPLYPLKRIRDKILYLFNSHPVKKIELSLLFADKKIGMAQSLLDKKNAKLASEFMVESQKDLLFAASELPSLEEDNNLPPGLPDKIELAAKKHREIIKSLSESLRTETQVGLVNEALEINNQATEQIASMKEKSDYLNN